MRVESLVPACAEYYLYARWPGQKTMRPVNWRKGCREVNLVHATRFSDAGREAAELSLKCPENAGIVYEWRKVPDVKPIPAPTSVRS